MLRFGTPATERKTRPATRERWRLWLLFAAACVVLFGIRILREPETAERIDSLFVPGKQVDDTPATINEVLAAEPGEVAIGPAVASPAFEGHSLVGDNPAREGRFDLSAVRYNSYFPPD